MPVRSRISGQLSAYAIATTMPPRNIEPVSPMNTFAGLWFQTRKPAHPPISTLAMSETPKNLCI